MGAPSFVVRLSGDHFERSRVACLGWQLAEVLQAVSQGVPDTQWYYADVSTNGANPFSHADTEPIAHGGGTHDMLDRTRAVDQFLSGIFWGVYSTSNPPQLRNNPTTEDPDSCELGDAFVEVRTFDTTYIEVLTSDNSALTSLASRFPDANVQHIAR